MAVSGSLVPRVSLAPLDTGTRFSGPLVKWDAGSEKMTSARKRKNKNNIRHSSWTAREGQMCWCRFRFKNRSFVHYHSRTRRISVEKNCPVWTAWVAVVNLHAARNWALNKVLRIIARNSWLLKAIISARRNKGKKYILKLFDLGSAWFVCNQVKTLNCSNLYLTLEDKTWGISKGGVVILFPYC